LEPKVTITRDGREGRVRYRDRDGEIEGYFEFGGNDVVAILSMGAREDWARHHPWAMARRAEILRRVADAALKDAGPSCKADIEDDRGVVLIRTKSGEAPAGPVTPSPQAKAAAFVTRFADLRATLASIVLCAAIIGGAIMWFGQKTLSVAPSKGVPLNEPAQYASDGAGGIASLIQTADAHLPNWTGRGGGETVSVKLLLIPADGGAPALVPVASGLSPTAVSLARIIGSDGRTLWLDVAGLYGVRLADKTLTGPKELAAANPNLETSWWDDPRDIDIVDGRLHAMRRDRSAAIDVDPATWAAAPVAPKPSNARFERSSPDDLLAAGVVIAPGVWLGLHTQAELARSFRPGKWVRPVESADRTKEARRLARGALEASSGGARHRIRSIAPVGETEYRDAAFLRPDAKSAPRVLDDPASVTMVHTSVPGGTLIVSRVGDKGEVLWSADTGLDRHTLRRIFPGDGVMAFVGNRPPEPGKLSEPMVVLIDARTGQVAPHTLWR
jgi:hypothetical protein